jgi:hypothetical protein
MEYRPCICYGQGRRSQMDRLHDRIADYDVPAMPSEAELCAAMKESERDVAAGRTLPPADVLSELDDVGNRIEARRRARRV